MLFGLKLLILTAAALTTAWGWRDAFRVYGSRAPALGWRVVRLRCRQPVRYGTFTFQLLLVILTGSYFLPRLLTGSGSMETGVVVAIAASVLFGFAEPPSVVFLGTSTEDGKRLYSRVRWAVPGRCLSLLQSGAFEVVHGTSFTRTRDDAWQSTVRELAMLAALVVVDARLTSPAVRREAEWIVDSELRRRAVFVRGDDGRDVVLQELRASRPDARLDDLNVIQEHQVGALGLRLSAARANRRGRGAE